jgi:uncharacterized protein
MPPLQVQEGRDGVVFTAKVVPGSSRTAVAGLLGGMVKIKVAAPPEKGKANQALVAFLAECLGVKKNDVTILAGHGNPVKQVQVAGMTAQMLVDRLGLGK